MNWKKWWIKLVVGMWCGAFALSCQANDPRLPFDQTTVPTINQPVQVMRVVSGQTIEVQYPNATDATNQTVRLIGIDAPAYNQNPWDKAAKDYLESLLLGQTISLEMDEYQSDENGRQFAYVWLDDQLVNQMLVSEGYVLESARSPNLKYDTVLKQAQHRARLLGLGIWNPDQPMRQTPAEFRNS